MKAYGSDRVRTTSDGRILLASRLSKGWQPRARKTNTSAEFPGTAVLWDDTPYEVVAVNPLAQGGVQYVLAPWPDNHVIRLAERYDDASEARRLTEHRANQRRERNRMRTYLLAPLAGLLPASVQEELASELGVVAESLTAISAIPGIVFGGVCLYSLAASVVDTKPLPLPVWAIGCGLYLLFESVPRFVWGISGRSIGSPLGVLGYLLSYSFASDRSGLPPPFRGARERENHTAENLWRYAKENELLSPTEPMPGEGALATDVEGHDALLLREPLLTLLSPAEQKRLSDRFRYDYRQYSSEVALLILVIAGLGAFTSAVSWFRYGRLGTLVSAAAAAGVALEQIWRLRRLRSAPAGSVLAFLVRPFVRRLL